jgi:hypothetical protein
MHWVICQFLMSHSGARQLRDGRPVRPGKIISDSDED